MYIRVSTDMQAEDGFSIDGQITRLTSYVESQDWKVYDTYIDDGFSAKDLNRPGMKKLMDDMKNRLFDIVLVYKLDRLTRSVADLHSLLKTFDLYGVKFKSATEIFETTTAMGRFFITLVGAMAEWERGTISERVRFGVEQMVREGKRPGGNRPYGYTQNEVLIPEEARLIRMVRDMYLSGHGYKSIAMELNKKNLLRRGKEWTDSTVAYTLENPYYAGIIRLGSKTPEGTYVNSNRDERVSCIYGDGGHDPIFTKEEYDEIKSFMKKKSQGGYSKIETYWFSGSLRCGRCGAAMFGKLTTKKKRNTGEVIRRPYYICSNRHHNKSCNLPIFRQSHIEYLMMDYIQNIKAENELILDVANKPNAAPDKEEIAQLKKELSKVSERKEKWKYMFVENIITQDEFRKRMKDEQTTENQIKEQMAEKETFLSGIPKIDQLIDLENAWGLANDAERKELICAIFDRIVVNTDLTNIKGVKNKFFDAYISEVIYN